MVTQSDVSTLGKRAWWSWIDDNRLTGLIMTTYAAWVGAAVLSCTTVGGWLCVCAVIANMMYGLAVAIAAGQRSNCARYNYGQNQIQYCVCDDLSIEPYGNISVVVATRPVFTTLDFIAGNYINGTNSANLVHPDQIESLLNGMGSTRYKRDNVRGAAGTDLINYKAAGYITIEVPPKNMTVKRDGVQSVITPLVQFNLSMHQEYRV